MKNQALFSSKDKSKILKRHLLQFLFGALRVKLSYRLDLKNIFELNRRFFVNNAERIKVIMS